MSRRWILGVVTIICVSCDGNQSDAESPAVPVSNKAVDAAQRQKVVQSFATSMNDPTSNAAVRLGYARQLAESYPETKEGIQAKSLIRELTEAEAREKIGSQWRYGSEAEQMGRGKTFTASVTSSTPLNLASPYDGEQWPVFALRSHPKYGKDAILLIDEGQILCRSYESCTVSISIDGKPPRDYEAYGAADNSTTSAFIRGHDRLVRLLAGGKEMKIQFPVYQNGEPVLTFNIEGFDPDKYIEPRLQSKRGS